MANMALLHLSRGVFLASNNKMNYYFSLNCTFSQFKHLIGISTYLHALWAGVKVNRYRTGTVYNLKILRQYAVHIYVYIIHIYKYTQGCCHSTQNNLKLF